MYAGFVYHLIDRIMQWRLNIQKQYSEGDRVTLLLQPYDDPDRKWIARILALDYEGVTGWEQKAYFFRETGRSFGAHYDPDGVEIALHLTNSPLREWEEITSLLGDRRRHKGIDFKCPRFTPVYAPISGNVSRINWNTRANGNCIELISDDGTIAMKFLHLEKFPKGIKEGMRVNPGDQIALTGNTGKSQAPHLHFQMEMTLPSTENGDTSEDESEGVVVDPFWVLESTEHGISMCDQPAFNAVKTEYDKLLTQQE